MPYQRRRTLRWPCRCGNTLKNNQYRGYCGPRAVTSAHRAAGNPRAPPGTPRRCPRSPLRAGCRWRDQPPAGLQQRGCRAQDRRLLRLQFIHGPRGLTPLEIGIAAQRAEPAARGVHQHPVDLAREAFHAQVVLVLDRLSIQIGQSGALQPRFQAVEARAGDVERVDAAVRLHQRARIRLLPRGAAQKIHQQVFPPRRDQYPSSCCPRPALEIVPSRTAGGVHRRPALHPDADRRVRRGRASKPLAANLAQRPPRATRAACSRAGRAGRLVQSAPAARIFRLGSTRAKPLHDPSRASPREPRSGIPSRLRPWRRRPCAPIRRQQSG